MKILRLDCSGHPIDWICAHDAALLMSKNQVVWTLGEVAAVLRGGWNNKGRQSRLEVPAIIASEGKQMNFDVSPALDNKALFRRDQNLCLYCGHTFVDRHLSRDHVIPQCQKGPDIWENVVTACKRCNQAKGGRTPEQAGMKLLAVPFVPNPFEFMYLENRHIIADQMDYLKTRFTNRRNWAA